MTIDIKHILSLPADERDDEIRKLIFKCDKPGFIMHRWMASIALDWNLAMEKRDEVCSTVIGAVEMEQSLRDVFVEDSELRTHVDYKRWLSCFVDPIHYILAAIVVGEGK